jgi:hypothetical protein
MVDAVQASLPSIPEPDSIDQAAAAMVTGNHPVSSTAVAAFS